LYKKVFLIDASDPQARFEAECRALVKKFNEEWASITRPSDLVEVLARKEALLIFLNAGFIQDISSGPHNFAFHVIRCAQSQKRCSVPVLFLVGDAKVVDGKHGASASPHIVKNLATPKAQRFALFIDQIQYFHELRGNEGGVDFAGFRVKRARWLLEGVENEQVWPIDIRMLALFASNLDNHAYFDPTGGFENLLGRIDSDLPAEIILFRGEVSLYIQTLCASTRQSDLVVLRWLSTAVYWVTASALDHLRNGRGSQGIESAKIDADSLEKRLEALDTVMRSDETVGGEGNPETIYTVPLGVRAIVQDHWREQAPLARSLAHHRIAKRLFKIQNEKNLLTREFPFEPHWGRSRHYFVAESLRHLIRACESTSGLPHSSLIAAEDNQAFIARQFPDEPGPESSGRYVTVVVRFCYDVLYQKELNGNHSPKQRGRALSKRHGAYHLSIELLQLMSGGSAFPEPHSSFSDPQRLTYYNEVGFAELDLGRLRNAEACFFRARDDALDTNTVSDFLRAQLNLAIVWTTVGDAGKIRDARNLVNHVAQQLTTAELETDHSLKSALDGLRKQIKTRTAELDYLSGNSDCALRQYREINPRSIRRETAYHMILALLDGEDNQNLHEAKSLCIQNVFTCTSRGDQHEALIFRILLARTMRKLKILSASEQGLDLVFSDIIRHGCSARVHFEFLLEAGKNLLAQDRSARAYAAYILPCYERSCSFGFERVSRYALDLGLRALDHIETTLDDSLDQEDTASIMRVQLDGSSGFQELKPSQLANARPADPLASFDQVEVEAWANVFCSSKGVAAERQRLRSKQLVRLTSKSPDALAGTRAPVFELDQD
jgi:hypothetical protein